MISLDQATTTPAPAIWTPTLVQSRLIEAFEIEARMPSKRFAAIASAWPATRYEFHEIVSWGNDARERVLDEWSKACGASPREVSRMDEALHWLSWLEVGERKMIGAWAVGKTGRKSVRAIMRRQDWSPSTFYRTIDKAAQQIAERLNVQGVQVR